MIYLFGDVFVNAVAMAQCISEDLHGIASNEVVLFLYYQGHSSPVLNLDVSVNGKYMASCSEDQSIRLWSIKEFGSGNKSALCNVEFDHAHQICFSPDSR